MWVLVKVSNASSEIAFFAVGGDHGRGITAGRMVGEVERTCAQNRRGLSGGGECRVSGDEGGDAGG